MRAERLIHIITLLQNRERMTTEAIATELHVSIRTILRDMDALSVAGIPVYSVRGKDGGWSLLEGFTHNLSTLKPEELQSLLVLPSDKVLQDLGIKKEPITVREKLLRVLPKDGSDQTKMIWDRVYVDFGTWRNTSAEEHPYLEVVQQAVFENRKLKILYKSQDQQETERTLEPLGLVAKQNKWYLIARKKDQFRNYRVSRIVSATLLSEQFERPDQFHLKSYWEKSKADFINRLPEYHVQVEMRRSILTRITYSAKFIHALEIKPNEHNEFTEVNLTFHTKQEALEYVLGFGSDIKVLTPTDLKEDMLKSAQAIIDLYDK